MRKSNSLIGLILLVLIFAFYFWDFLTNEMGTLVRQYRAQSFPVSPGLIVSAKVGVNHGSKSGTTYTAYFVYDYVVNGVRYRGQRYRYDRFPSTRYAVENLVFHIHPVGSMVAVYYNPILPADAVISPQVAEENVSDVLLMGGGGCLFACVLLIVAQDAFRSRAGAVAGGIKILTRPGVIRARLPRFLPIVLALAVTGAGFLFSSFYMQSSIHLSPVIAGVKALFGSLALGTIAYLWQWWRIASGTQDLMINEGTLTVELPLNYGRRKPRSRVFSDITAVVLIQPLIRAGVVTSPIPMRRR